MPESHDTSKALTTTANAVVSSSAAATASQPPPVTIPFGAIPEIPTQEAIDGIRFDFNFGLRVKIPKTDGKSYRIRFVDLDNKCNLYDIITPKGQEGLILSKKRYYVNFRLVISRPEDDQLLFMHDYNAKGKDVVLRFPEPGLGDAIAWFSYMERFQQKHQCNLTCVVADWFSEIVRQQYPQIHFEPKQEGKTYDSYAMYDIGLGAIGDFDFQPIDHRYVGLHRTVARILDVSDEEIPPRFDLSAPRQISEKYVCIAVQATSLAKMWNNPIGWDTVVDFLLSKGYRVLCIDKERFTGLGGTYNRKPEKAEDFTGAKPLQERINLIKDAEFFIGLSSGLSWLAWGCKVPVVLISGFTNPINEFYTPFRVFNRNVCNSCWNDMTVKYDLANYWSCPRLGDQNNRFECTAQITPEKVIDTITPLVERRK